MEINHEGQTFFGELELTVQKGREKQITRTPTKIEIKSHVIKKPSAAVELLYRKKFFVDPHTLAETWNELRKEGFNFSRQSVLMALKAADYLTMTGKRGSYRFVQKFPPAND